jgi:hypothetical protein
MMAPCSMPREHQPQPVAVDFSDAELESMLRSYVQEGLEMPTPSAYHPRRLLRECIEDHVAFEGGPLARAARFAQRLDQFGTEWYVENVPVLVHLLDSAPHLEEGL